MESIRKSEIEKAFEKSYRIYLTGHLQKPQPMLEHIDDDIEVGLSEYEHFTADTPHVHPVCTEHGMVLKGTLRMKLLETGEEMEYHEGDFFVLRPGNPYAAKNAPGTRILFIKYPAVNDKTPVEVDDETRKWLEQW